MAIKRRISRQIREQAFEELTPEQQEQWQKMSEYRQKAVKESQSKLAEHLTTFNDGVIAIIITIIVLEIGAPLKDADFSKFFGEIILYLISFFGVANFWYEIHRAFSFFIPKANKRTMVFDFAFLAALSLIPVMTKWLMADLSVLSVVSYGIVFFLVQSLELATEVSGMRTSVPHAHLYRRLVGRYSWMRLIWLFALNLVFIGISFFSPRLGMILYLAFPIINFLTPDNSRKRK